MSFTSPSLPPPAKLDAWLSETIENLASGMVLDRSSFTTIEETRIIVSKVITRFSILVSSRFGSKAEIIETVSDMFTTVPINISMNHWDEMFNSARIYVNGTPKGTLKMPVVMIDQIKKFYDNGFDQGVELKPWRNFSKLLRIAKKEFTVLTGTPGSGKSEFMDAIMMILAMQENWRFAVFSPENYPYCVHIEKLLSKYNGKAFHKKLYSNGSDERMTMEEVIIGTSWINEHFAFVQPDEDHLNLESVLSITLQEHIKNPFDALIIDPFNELDCIRPQKFSETEHIGEQLKKIRRFGRANDLAMFVVAHPAKIHKDKNGDMPIPTLYDINGSAHWRNKCDNGMVVVRNEDNTVDVHVQKVKFKMRGEVGCTKFNYDKISGIYTEKQISNNSLPLDNYYESGQKTF